MTWSASSLTLLNTRPSHWPRERQLRCSTVFVFLITLPLKVPVAERVRGAGVLRDQVGDGYGLGGVLVEEEDGRGRRQDVHEVSGNDLGVAVRVLGDDWRVPALYERVPAPVVRVLAVLHRDRRLVLVEDLVPRSDRSRLGELRIGVQFLRHDHRTETLRPDVGAHW